MDASVGQGGVEVPVPQQRLNGGDFAARVDQLGGIRVAQLVRRHSYTGSYPRRLDTAAQEIFARVLWTGLHLGCGPALGGSS